MHRWLIRRKYSKIVIKQDMPTFRFGGCMIKARPEKIRKNCRTDKLDNYFYYQNWIMIQRNDSRMQNGNVNGLCAQ